jgi:uncharacterized membrane protein HdeD (DUF308 family)
MEELKSPGWIRGVQIGLGAVAVILSIFILINPALSTVYIVLIASIILLIVGIEQVILGLFVKQKSRFVTIGLGVLVIILSSILIAYPKGTTILLIYILAFALLINGASRLIHGWRDRLRRGWSRGFRIGVGALEIGLAIAILVSPNIGATLVGILIAIALLIVGIQIIIAGIFGRRSLLRRATDR